MSDSTPKLALQIVLNIGASAQNILYPVPDQAEAARIMALIKKTSGFVTLSEGSDNPIMFHVRHVVMTQMVVLPDAPVRGLATLQ